jgi:drug/metabolite transporter (DMT)-like permease
MGIKKVDLSKSAAINYTKIVFVFIFGGIFLGEKVFFTDIIGTLLILSYMLYNLFYPINIKENKN